MSLDSWNSTFTYYEIRYLKRAVGHVLNECIAELIQVRPVDPVEYMGLWMRRYVDTQNYYKNKKKFIEELIFKNTLMIMEKTAAQDKAHELVQETRDELELKLAQTEPKPSLAGSKSSKSGSKSSQSRKKSFKSATGADLITSRPEISRKIWTDQMAMASWTTIDKQIRVDRVSLSDRESLKLMADMETTLDKERTGVRRSKTDSAKMASSKATVDSDRTGAGRSKTDLVQTASSKATVDRDRKGVVRSKTDLARKTSSKAMLSKLAERQYSKIDVVSSSDHDGQMPYSASKMELIKQSSSQDNIYAGGRQDSETGALKVDRKWSKMLAPGDKEDSVGKTFRHRALVVKQTVSKLKQHRKKRTKLMEEADSYTDSEDDTKFVGFVEEDTSLTPEVARWKIIGAGIVCSHPVLGLLRLTRETSEISSIEWVTKKFAVESFYDPELYTNDSHLKYGAQFGDLYSDTIEDVDEEDIESPDRVSISNSQWD